MWEAQHSKKNYDQLHSATAHGSTGEAGIADGSAAKSGGIQT